MPQAIRNILLLLSIATLLQVSTGQAGQWQPGADTDYALAGARFDMTGSGPSVANLTVAPIKKDASMGVNFIYLYAPGAGPDNTTAGMQSLISNAKAYSSALPMTILTMPGNGILAGQRTFNNGDAQADVRSYGLSVGVTITDALSISGSLSYAHTDNQKKSSDYGWEYNLGAAYRLKDNLKYKAHFGYFAPGGYFADKPALQPGDSIYLLSNSITMTF